MNISQIYLTLDYDSSVNDERYKYQIETTYIQLFVEQCFRKNKIDLGAFNRLVFSEGGDASRDFNVVGNNALPVATSATHRKRKDLITERNFHDYYIGKLIEGFDKFDSHFKSNFVEYLKPLLDVQFNDTLSFEKKLASKSVNGLKLQVISKFQRLSFQIIVHVYCKKELIKSETIFECEPDMFIVKYDAYKVEIDNVKIKVTNKIGEDTLKVKVASFI